MFCASNSRNKGFPPLPDHNGRTFQSTLEKAIESKASVIQIAASNDWGERTQIEPSSEFGYRDLETVQVLRRKHVDKAFAFKPPDLHLPLRLLQRRSRPGDTKRMDDVAELIANRDLKQARTELE